MLAEPVAGAFDLDDDGMMKQAVEQGCGDHGIAEDVGPLGKATIGGQDHGAPLVPGGTSTNTLRQKLPFRSNGSG